MFLLFASWNTAQLASKCGFIVANSSNIMMILQVFSFVKRSFVPYTNCLLDSFLMIESNSMISFPWKSLYKML